MNSNSIDGRRMSILVIAEFFPSRNQSAVFNAVEEIIRHGGEVTVVANRKQGKSYPDRFESLGLLSRTRYMPLGTPRDILRGLRPYLVPFNIEGQLAYRGLQVLLANRRGRPTGFRSWLKSLVQTPLLAKSCFDLVHAHYLIGGYQFLSIARLLGVPLVTTFHGLPVIECGPEISGAKATELFREGSLFLVNTRFAKSQLEGLGCRPEKIRILPQGLRLEDFPYRPRPYPREGPTVLLTVARLSGEKGHRYALQAVRLLRDRDRQVEYRIVGTGPEKVELEKLIRELRLEDCVFIRGERTDAELRREYEEAHILILPSVKDISGSHHTETQGIVIQEAQASGVITIASETGGIPECVDNGRSAFLVPERDPEALAERITWLLDNPERWPTWQREGRLWVETHYAMEKIGKRLWDTYGEMIASHKQPRILTGGASPGAF